MMPNNQVARSPPSAVSPNITRRPVLRRNRTPMINRRPIPIIITRTAIRAYHNIMAVRVNIYLMTMISPINHKAVAASAINNINRRMVSPMNMMYPIRRQMKNSAVTTPIY